MRLSAHANAAHANAEPDFDILIQEITITQPLWFAGAGCASFASQSGHYHGS
jgi:hypothetical protein